MLLIDPNAQPYLKSLTACLNKVVQEGFTEDFKVLDEGILAVKCGHLYPPEAIEIINCIRFAGKGHKNGEAALFIMQANDGIKGTFVDTYKPNSGPGAQLLAKSGKRTC